MKKLSLIALAAAGLLLSACSSDKDEIATAPNQYDLVEGEDSWIAVGIAMPGDATSTRANEDLNDGDASEYEVKSGTLVLFKGASEDAATLVAAYDITSELTFGNEAGDQVPGGNTEGTSSTGFGEITSTSQKVVKQIANPELGTTDNLYAYVILNNVGNATGIAYTVGQAFSVFKKQVLKAIGIDGKEANGYGAMGSTGLVMTNVPIADNPGGDTKPIAATKVTTLAKVDPTAIYKSAAEAKAGTGVACIYVERAAVKVEVKVTATKVVTDKEELTFTLSGWALGNVNYGGPSGTGYYNTRQFNTDWLGYNNVRNATPYTKYRMVGRTPFWTTAVEGDHNKGYRTYFGEDVNYDVDTDDLLHFLLTDGEYTQPNNGITYTYENTFDQDHQKYHNTTYVGFKGVVNSATTFYTLENQPNTKLSNAADIEKALSSVPEVATEIANTISLLDAQITADLGKPTGDPTRQLPGTITQVTYDIKPIVTLTTKDDATGVLAYTWTLALSNIKIQGGTAMDAANAAKVQAMFAGVKEPAHTVNASSDKNKVLEYTGGVVYYAARIAHFGDVETPWSAPELAKDDYDKIYPADGKSLHTTPVVYSDDPATRASAWLGRWGIVRNNWYELTIESITGLGSPVPVNYHGTAGNTPDDNVESAYYIAAHIHILPWVKRKQSVDLK